MTALTDPRMLAVALVAVSSVLSSSAHAADDKYKVTKAEKAACTADAMRFCMYTYPDEDKLVGCMKENHDSLSSTCRVAFDAGVRRRHL